MSQQQTIYGPQPLSSSSPNLRVLGLDPGLVHLGAAILEDETCIWHLHLSTNQPHTTAYDDPICRWWIRLSAIVCYYRPQVIIYEDYVFQGHQRTSANAPLMWQQIGIIRALGSLEGVDTVATLRPEVWRRQLTRNGHAGDHEVATIIKIRLGIEPLEEYGKSKGSHILDAVGVALVWMDERKMS